MRIPSRGSLRPDSELFRKAAQLSSVAYSIGVPPIIGYALDWWMKISPVCLILGTLLGFITGMIQLFRFAGVIGNSTGRKSEQPNKPGSRNRTDGE